MHLRLKRLHPDAILPRYAHEGDAGLDLYAIEEAMLRPGERRMFPLGFAMELDQGYVSLVWDKSGVSGNYGIKVMGGVIDEGYRGEIRIVLLNTSAHVFCIHKGDKIAQLLIQQVEHAQIQEVPELSDTSRGIGAFGSTGRR
jgi:dUTP pyrophosphatase